MRSYTFVLVLVFSGGVVSSGLCGEALPGLDIMSVQAAGQTPSYGQAPSYNVPVVQSQASSWAPAQSNSPLPRRSDGSILVQVMPRDTLKGIAQRVYGDPNLWPLIYLANPQLTQGGQSNGALTLVVPPPPSSRVFQHQGRLYVRMMPGDTYRSLARSIYGSEDMWMKIYMANRNLNPQQQQRMLTRYASQASAQYVPNPNQPASPPMSWPNFPSNVRATPVPQGYRSSPQAQQYMSQPQQYQQQQQASSGRLQGTGNPLASLNLRGPQDIGPREADIILRTTGFLSKRNPTMQRAIRSLMRGYYVKNHSGSLTNAVKEKLFIQYKNYRAALARWGNYANIGSKSTPQLTQQWVREAANRLTAVPAHQREALMWSLMNTESSRNHWTNHVPIVGPTGDIGFGQFLPRTAAGLGINPYDPQQNIQGIAMYLNQKIRRHGLRKGLAAYNGGDTPPSKSYAYADRILRGARM